MEENEVILTTEQANEAVNKLLEENGIQYEVQNAGVRDQETEDGHKYIQDAWVCIFKRDKREERFEYYTGTAHRHPANLLQKRQAEYGFPGLTEKDRKGQTSYGRRYLAAVEAARKPQPPEAAGAIYCFMLSLEANQMSFNDWCAEFGYDNDSRKAFKVYESCQEEADKFCRIFHSDVRKKLQEFLRDY